MDENQDVMEVIAQAITEMDEGEGSAVRKHHRNTETTTVKSVLARLQTNKIKLPLCQRLYVWNKAQRMELWESIKSNYSIGTIILVDVNGEQFLVDGLQRLTSCIYLSVDHDNIGMTEAEKTEVQNYLVDISVVYDMTPDEVKTYFGRLNSGVSLASVVKARSKLSKPLNEAILKVADNEWIRNAAKEGKTKATFAKGHHHELIAMNALLAAADLPITDNKAAVLCKQLADHEAEVLAVTDKAVELMEKVARVFRSTPDEISKRALSANYACVLTHLIAHKDPHFSDLVALTNRIFEGTKAIPEYSSTTRSQAADASRCRARYDLLVSLLEQVGSSFDLTGFKEWRGNTPVLRADDGVMVDTSAFSEFELRSLYQLWMDRKSDKYKTVITKRYQELEGVHA